MLPAYGRLKSLPIVMKLAICWRPTRHVRLDKHDEIEQNWRIYTAVFWLMTPHCIKKKNNNKAKDRPELHEMTTPRRAGKNIPVYCWLHMLKCVTLYKCKSQQKNRQNVHNLWKYSMHCGNFATIIINISTSCQMKISNILDQSSRWSATIFLLS
jgi:hypothetical protein